MKTSNILIHDKTDLNSVKIIDFGLGERQMLMKANDDATAGTLLYMAPEVVIKSEYTKSVDVWAIGIIMHILLTGKHPFYIKGQDDSASFKIKLKNLQKVEPDQNLSWLAKNLF